MKELATTNGVVPFTGTWHEDEDLDVTSASIDDVQSRASESSPREGSRIVANETTGPTFDLEDIYPDRSFSPMVGNVLRLIDESKRTLDEAINLARAEELFGSDDIVMTLAALLDELYCCRSIGRGFSAAVNSCRVAVRYREDALSVEQLRALRVVLHGIRSEPFVALDQAPRLVEPLSLAGLHIVHPELAVLADV